MNDFVHLHNHSTFSYLDGFGRPEAILDSAKEKGFKAMALTDHGSLDGLITFYFEAKKREIKPILGVEAYVCQEHTRLDRSGVNTTFHITLLAKSARGYTSLCRLMTAAHCQGFYYKPRIDWALLEKEGDDLIVLSGCPNGAFLGLPETETMGWLRRMKKRFGPDFYVEAMPVPEPLDYPAKAEYLSKLGAKLGIKTVMTADCHYPNKDQAEIQDIMLSINLKREFDDPDRMKMAPIYWQRSVEELRGHAAQWMPWLGAPKAFNAAVSVTQEIADKINIELGKTIPIKFPSGAYTSMGLLQRRINEGKIKRKLPWSQVYQARLKREVDLIQEKGFADYFLMVADVCAWAKSRGILMGPARGSSAGSLVCYLMGITEVNPIPFGLLFERFIDHTRNDLPDIDLDFEDRARGEVIEYLKSKYGHVGVLSTWSEWKAKNCLLDVARIFKIPQEEVRKITPLVIQRSGGDARASFTLEDTFAEFDVAKRVLAQYPQLAYSSKLESQVRQKSRHPAGVIISTEPTDTFAHKFKDDCLSIDGAQAKSLGAMKLDVLGINTLTVIAQALDAIKKRHHKIIDIYNLNLEDPKVIEGFSSRKLAGIFQYEGGAMRSVNRQIHANCFNDIVIINAASRPGPLHCGGANLYVRRRNGQEEVKYLHPIAQEITESTLGVVMYQEQVIKLLTKLGKMSWQDTNTARHVMSGRRGTEVFNKLFDKFKIGARENGMEDKEIQEVWDQVCTHGSWSFNMSHSVSYSVLAYWTMFLKVYYPAEFYWASISYTSDEDRQHELLKEWKKSGGKVLQVAPGRSSTYPVLEGNAIRMGWASIRGIGEALAERLTRNGPYKSTADLVQRAKPNKSQLQLLEDLGIIERMQLDIFRPQDSKPDQALLVKHCPYLYEIDFGKYRDDRCTILSEIEPKPQNQKFTIVGLIRAISIRDLNEVNARRGQTGSFEKATGNTKWVNILLEDEDDSLLVTFSRKSYPQWQKTIWKDGGIGNIIRVSGMVLPDYRKLYGNELKIVGRA